MPEERKLVTILFADVTGSTALGDSLDPEDIRALMGRYYTHARSVVRDHGGTLEKFIGDAVMAVFGLPHALGDDAERALAAALALRAAVANDEMLGPAFLLRIGVNTGEVIATSDTTNGDFLVTGDAANVTARLQQNANPGEILVSERTMHATQDAFLFEASRQIEVKGKRQPLQVFPLKEARPVRKIERPPLVGRRQDLLQLSLLQARTLEEQRPQLVSIVAPAGTGKTRLLEEFLARLDPADGFQIATARCLPYGKTLIYWPLRGLLADLLGKEITQAHLVTIYKDLVAAFNKAGYKQEDAGRLSDLILTTLGIEGDGASTDRESIFMAWRLLVEALAQQAPRIIIFEDLHWASDSLLDLVDHITHLRTQAALLLIALSRPELLDRRPTWGGGRQNFTSLALQPLTPAQTHDLVDRLLKDAPQTTRDLIVERSGGNPFFALELTCGLGERHLTGSAASLNVLPDTVHAAVLARLDQLSKPERAVVQVASVASRAFTATMLADVLHEYSPQQIETALDNLLARDLITSSEGSACTFRHILIRDVAYGTLSRTERIRLHEQIASSLENAAREHLDEYVELIAYHYREAVQLSRQSAVRSTLPIPTERAIRFLRRAATLAGRTGAYAEALAYLQSAISIAPPSELVSLYEQAGDSQWWTISAVESYQKALESWRKDANQQSTPLIGARLLRKLLIQYIRGGVRDFLGTEHLSSWRAEAQTLAEQAGDEGELWHVRLVDLFTPVTVEPLSSISSKEREVRKQLGLEAVAYFERKKDWAAFSEALDGYGFFCLRLGDYVGALEAAQRRLSAPDLPAIEYGDALQVVAGVYSGMGDLHTSIETVKQALNTLRPGQPIIHLGSAISIATSIAFECGRWADIDFFKPWLEEAREQSSADPKASFVVFNGYLIILFIAQLREDRAMIDAAGSVLIRIVENAPQNELTSEVQAFVSALLSDDLQEMTTVFANVKTSNIAPTVAYLGAQYDIIIPQEVLAIARSNPHLTKIELLIIEAAQALADKDYPRLAQTVDDLEAHQYVVGPAHLRIVLARHTGERAQLERARPVLERLNDRKFLRLLKEVEEAMTPYAG